MKACRLLWPLCVIMLTACSSSSGNTSLAGLSGNWQITLQNTSASETQSGFLLQSGTAVTGSFMLSGQTISGQTVCAEVGSASGQITGSNLAITVSPAGQTINLTGTQANSTSMSGNYSLLASGCGQTEIGTWTATQVSPLSGNLQATFTPYGGSAFHFTGAVTEGPNTGGSTATLSGSMTSTDSPCFTSATVAGLVSGTSVVFNLLNSDGVALGKYSGTMTTDATSITGTFKFSNASDPGALGACENLGGTVAVTVQTSTSTT